MSMLGWRQVDWKQVDWKEVVWRDSNDTTDFPSALKLLWPVKLTDAGVLKSAVGPAPVFTDTPTVDSSGVTPGDGPSFTDPVDYSKGGTRVKEFTMTTASADIVGAVAMGSGFFVTSAGILFSDGTNATPVLATSWGVGDVVVGVVEVFDDGVRPLMRVRREWV